MKERTGREEQLVTTNTVRVQAHQLLSIMGIVHGPGDATERNSGDGTHRHQRLIMRHKLNNQESGWVGATPCETSAHCAAPCR